MKIVGEPFDSDNHLKTPQFPVVNSIDFDHLLWPSAMFCSLRLDGHNNTFRASHCQPQNYARILYIHFHKPWSVASDLRGHTIAMKSSERGKDHEIRTFLWCQVNTTVYHHRGAACQNPIMYRLHCGIARRAVGRSTASATVPRHWQQPSLIWGSLFFGEDTG
jgi:hypothetical protein